MPEITGDMKVADVPLAEAIAEGQRRLLRHKPGR
jgi:hypothetical protein